MTRRSIRFTAVARRNVATVSEWWIANRPNSPAAFVDELDTALALVAAMPQSGSIYPTGRRREVRRVLLACSGYHVYYAATDDAVIIRAVWHVARGRGPAL